MIKVFIPSRNRAETMTTFRLLPEDYPWYIIVDNEEMKEKYIRAANISEERIVVSGVSAGIAQQRQWILDNFGSPDTWICMMDDNIRGFRAPPEDIYRQETLVCDQKRYDLVLAEKFRQKVGWSRVEQILHEAIAKAENVGAKHCGFATVDNYFFRTHKWRYCGYVKAKLALWKNVGLKYDPKVNAMEEYGYVAENLLHYGKVLINNYLSQISTHYQPGGIGTYEDRVQSKISDSAYLIQKYPGLFRYFVKKDCHPEAELVIRLSSPKQIQSWREQMFIQPWVLNTTTKSNGQTAKA